MEKDKEYYQAVESLIWNSLSLFVGIDDAFNLGVYDVIEVDGEDIEWIIPLYKKYGYETIVAYASYFRDMKPLEKYQTDEFSNALLEIKKHYKSKK